MRWKNERLSPVQKGKTNDNIIVTNLALGNLVGNSQNTGNGLSDGANLGKSGRGTASDLGNAKSLQLVLQVVKLVNQLTLGLVSELVCLDFLDCR